MFKFILKGILRDKNRSLLPVIIISFGVMLTVFLSGYLTGVLGDMVDQNANFDTGHVKVMTTAYAENIAQLPNDLALLDVEELIGKVEADFPEMQWVKRTRFGGLIDVPDADGLTKGQGPAAGMSFEIFSGDGSEIERMNLSKSLVNGKIPTEAGEAIIGHEFSEKLGVKLGETFTFFGSTMNGSMSLKNFKVVGTVRFGMPALDKGAIIVDITDAQEMLDMQNGTAELLGFFDDGIYDDEKAAVVAEKFNADFAENGDEFAPIMKPLRMQNDLDDYLAYVDSFTGILVGLFIFIMSVVLWNTGLLGGLRRYQEFGIRLALGESKGQIYKSIIYEAVLIGTIGSIIGTIVGLGCSYYLQIVGYDISDMLQDSTMMMPTILRAKVTPELYYIGFIPGLFAMVLGSMLSGIGIYQRETAQLFKELEV